MARSTINTLYFLSMMLVFASAARLQPSLKMGPVSEEPQSGCSPSQVSGVLNQLQPCLAVQVHIALGRDATEMHVSWKTANAK